MQAFKFDNEGKGTDFWVKRLARNSLPVAGYIIAELNKLSEDNEADLNNLAEMILRDPSLTSHVLRVANSTQYNVSGQHVSTVSRAIVMIGLKGMRALCISLMLIESLLKNGAKQRMLEIMAQGFHAATQARYLIKKTHPEAAEEVFIAALLYHFGEMAYWAGNEINAKNEKLLKGSQPQRDKASQALLGTSFNRITRGLAKQWKLGTTLEEALSPSDSPSPKAKAVLLGEKISRAALEGWDSPNMHHLLAAVEGLTAKGQPSEEVMSGCLAQLKVQAQEALDIAKQFGAANVCQMIPGPDHAYIQEDPSVKMTRIMKSDPQLQLNILREMTATAAEKHSVNTIFQMVIEGIHRGIGMERVAIAFIKDFRAIAKHSLGYGAEDWKDTFNFDVGPYADNFIAEAVDKGGFFWIEKSFYRRHKNVRSKDTAKILGDVNGLIYVFEVKGKKPGLIYADRSDFGGLITQNHADSFQHFATQAQQCLHNIAPLGARRGS